MQEQYLGVMAAIGLAAVVSGVFVTGTYFLGPKKHTPYKDATYECGVTPVGDAHERFPIKFYLVAMLFILFDIEVVFLWSWMTVFRTSDTKFMVFSFFEFLTYMATWLVGYVYAVKVGATDWDETTSLAPEKLMDSPSIGTTGLGTESPALAEVR